MTLMLAAFIGIVAVAPTAEAAVETIKIPFAPQVGQYISYQLTLTNKADGKTSVTKLDQTLRFDRSPTGYILTIATRRLANGTTSIDLTTANGIKRIPAELRPLIMNMSFDVDTAGTILRVRDWPTKRAAIAKIPSTIVAAEASTQPDARELAHKAIAPYLAMSAEDAPAVLLKGWPSLFGLGGIEFVLGESYDSKGQTRSPLSGAPIELNLSSSLTRNEDGSLHLQLESSPDAASHSAAVNLYLERMSAGATAAQRENIKQAQQRFLGMKSRDTSSIDLDATTGLAQRATLERWVSIPGMGEGVQAIAVARTQ